MSAWLKCASPTFFRVFSSLNFPVSGQKLSQNWNWFVCFLPFSLSHRVAELNQRKFTSYNHCPTSIVLSSQLSVLSSLIRHWESKKWPHKGSDSGIKSGVEVEKSSGRKILSSFILFQLSQKQLQNKPELHKKTLTRSNLKIVLNSFAFLCPLRTLMLELIDYYGPILMSMEAFSQTCVFWYS